MARFAALNEMTCWFLVLPDCPAAAPATAAVRDQADRELTHPSGRPWIVGRWPAESVAAARAGSAAVAVIGQHAVTGGELERVAAGLHSVAALDGFARSLVGSAHLVASV